MSKSPSFSRGMNSPPSVRATGTLAAKRPIATATMTIGAADRAVEHGAIDSLQDPHQPKLFFLGLGTEAQRGERGHQGQGQHHRPGEREDDREHHRPEQFSLGPLQGKDRQVNNRDDQFAEHRRSAHFDGGVANDVELRPRSPS